MFNSGYYLFPLYSLLNWITLFCTLNLFGLFLPNIQNLIYSTCKFLIELHVVSTVYVKTYLQLISLNLDIVMHILTYKADGLISFY